MYDELGRIARIVKDRLLKHGLKGRTLTLKIKYGDFTQITRSRSLPFALTELEAIRETAIRFSLTKTFGPKSRARATYDTRENRMLAEYDYISQFGGIGTFGANVVASRADNEKGSVTANASYIGNRFEANVGYSQLVEGSNDAVRTQIQLGRSSVNTIEIVSGLQPGDRVILSDMSQWDSNDRIRLN